MSDTTGKTIIKDLSHYKDGPTKLFEIFDGIIGADSSVSDINKQIARTIADIAEQHTLNVRELVTKSNDGIPKMYSAKAITAAEMALVIGFCIGKYADRNTFLGTHWEESKEACRKMGFKI